MSVDYNFNAEEKLVEISCVGELVLSEVLSYFTDMKEDPRIEKGAIELVDLSGVNHLNLDFEDASAMSVSFIPAREAKEIRATIVYGMNRLNEGLVHLIRVHFTQSTPEHRFILEENERNARAHARRIHLEFERGAC